MFGDDATPDDEPTPPPSDPIATESPTPKPEPSAEAVGPTCQFCDSTRLIDCDDPPGIRCDDCGRLVWIDDGDSLRKVGWFDHDLAGIGPDELPPCDDCGRLCDVQTLDDAWHCSRCFPDDAAARRKRTQQYLSQAADVRRYTDARNG